VANFPGLALLLFACLLRTHAESTYYLLFIARRHAAIWGGNLLFLAGSCGLNLLLTPRFGITGMGAAAVTASSILLGWRLWFSRRGEAPSRTTQPAPETREADVSWSPALSDGPGAGTPS
jgi:O-antigen/teichoic acid export membrane protein